MAKTVVLDRLDLIELRVVRDHSDPYRPTRIFARYNLQSGSTTIQTLYKEITNQLSGSRKAAIDSLFDGATGELSAAEL